MASNGKIPKSQLARVYHPSLQLYLAKDAAASWNTMRMTSRRWLKVDLYPGGPDSAYRTVPRQQFWRNYWCGQGNCGNAAPVGYSNHGLGEAVDLPTRRMRWAIDRLGAQFGWAKKWSDAPQEWWHIKHSSGHWDRPDIGIDINNPIVRHGSGGIGQSWAVKKAQKLLVRHGFLARSNVTGNFGKATEAAIKKFQKAAGIKADGVVGARTWTALKRKNTPVVKPVAKKPVAKKPVKVAAKPVAAKPAKPATKKKGTK
jgi:hypothetical protein